MIENKEQGFYFGVVEDRHDPLMLGRCRIRVVGVHSQNKDDVKTEHLPWALPIQPITSAAMNGIGHAPVGPVEGTWCVVIFTDPESKQNPIFIGTIGGIPSNINIYDSLNSDTTKATPSIQGGNLVTSDGSLVVDGSGQPIGTGPQTPDVINQPESSLGATPAKESKPVLGSLTEEQVQKLKDAIKKSESSNNYKAVNTLGYIGGYQMGLAALEDLGYIKPGSWAKYQRNTAMTDSSIWTGKDGMTSQQAFLNSPSVQDKAMRGLMELNYKKMTRGGMASADTPPEKLAGLLSVAHLKGTGKGGVRDFLKGGGTPDAYGTTPSKYYNLGHSAIDPKTKTPELPTKQTIDNKTEPMRTSDTTATTASGETFQVVKSPAAEKRGDPSKLGFFDPHLKYPLETHINEPDTHRLARHQKIERTCAGEKEADRTVKISMANTDELWEQMHVPYDGQYPFNHVYASESGHVMEFDDTPERERIHLYHKTGTFTEWDVTGSKTEKVVGSRFTIIEDDDQLYILGTGTVTINGDLAVEVKKSNQVRIYGDSQVHIYGDSYQTVEKDIHQRCKNFHLYASESVHFKCGNSFNVTTGNKINLLGGGLITGDAGQVHWNSGLSSAATEASDLKPFDPNLVLQQPPSFITTDDANAEPQPGGASPAQPQTQSNPRPTQPERAQPPTTEPPPPQPVPTGAVEMPITRSSRLSPNFTVGDLCNSDTLPGKMIPKNGQHGLSEEEIYLNLQALAVNLLEPIKAKRPDMMITSGLRSPSSISKKSGTPSQHEKGMAADLQFKVPSTGSIAQKKAFYAELAREFQKFPHDQILLESRDSGSVWIHVSFSRAGNRRMALTLHNDKTINQGIVG